MKNEKNILVSYFHRTDLDLHLTQLFTLGHNMVIHTDLVLICKDKTEYHAKKITMYKY